MTWLKLTPDEIYLMKGGTSNQYIDKVTFQNIDNRKLIKKFPTGWFQANKEGTDIAPRTIIFGDESVKNKFTRVKILKKLELPINKKSYDLLKTCKSIRALINTYFDKIIGDFSDNFYQYQHTDSNDTDSIEDYDGHIILSTFRFSTPDDVDIDRDLEFEEIDFSDDDVTGRNPSFSSILLFASWKGGLTLRPNVKVNRSDKTIEVNLRFERKILETAEEPTISILEKSLASHKLDFPLQPLSTAINTLEQLWKIDISARNELLGKNIQANTLHEVTFSKAIDEIINSLNSAGQVTWDWQGESVRIDSF